MANKTPQSVEPNVADKVNGWLKSYGVDYKLEQEPLNHEIDAALDEYYSKRGGAGGNRPDAKALIQDTRNEYWPILIEYKGYKNKLEKLDPRGRIENRKKDNTPHYANINGYAANGAVHYANALLHYTAYSNIIAIGVTGYKDNDNLKLEIAVYLVSKSNFGVGQRLGTYSDLSFLKQTRFDEFTEYVHNQQLSPSEIDNIRAQREREIDESLIKLNNDIYQNEKGLSENDRVYLVAASIIATLGVPGKVAPLEKADLKSTNEPGGTDGEIVLRKVNSFLMQKALPTEKRKMIVRTLKNTLTAENLNMVNNGETQLKRVFSKIVDDLGIYYKIGLTTDFTGKLFNEMYSWLGFTQDKLNDVVLTPSYVAKLLVRLARVDRNSYVWDFATGSAGLLVAAMNEMMNDAKHYIESPDELEIKYAEIKSSQLLGLELLPSVYMLAVLNMIMMGDGSANVLNADSLTNFRGDYEYGNKGKPFPATAFVLNPPYSAEGNGMIFVERALSMMNKGYAAVIIQNSAGSGKAAEYNKRILKQSKLLASIKMPADLFIGKSSVHTQIYVFRVGEAHEPDDVVKFIDFSKDGYKRTNRRKARSTVNLRNVDHAPERYAELVNLVKFGSKKLCYLTAQDYFEGVIDPLSGSDWNQAAPADIRLTYSMLESSVTDHLSWELSSVLKQGAGRYPELRRRSALLTGEFSDLSWASFKLGDLFDHIEQGQRLKKDDQIPGDIPFVMSGTTNTGVVGYISNPLVVFPSNSITIDIFGNAFVREYEFGAGDDTGVYWNEGVAYTRRALIFIAASINRALRGRFSFGNKLRSSRSFDLPIMLPCKEGSPDLDSIERFISAIESEQTGYIEQYISELDSNFGF